MEKPKSTVEKLYTLLGIISNLLGILMGVLKLSESLFQPMNVYEFLWLGIVLLLISVGIWLLCLGLGSKSRLLQPDRFTLLPDEPRYLKGREEEIQELAELCERNPLVFLEGEAGSGKSALIRAGFVEKCRQRRLLQPLYVDLSGAPWEDGLNALLALEAWHSLTDDERTALELKTPPPPGTIFSHLTATASRLGRTTLIVFDQWDDYQNTYWERFREGSQGNTWITQEGLVEVNSFWAELDRLVKSDTIRCLFVTRTDNAAGLDAVRFVEARTCRLTRIDRNLIAPLLDEITRPEFDGRPVVVYPEKGWQLLKGRLLADIVEDDRILPVQLSIVLQALHLLPALTVREYERRGGAEGLERLHIERNLSEAARVSDLPLQQLRQILLAMTEPARSKTVQRRSSELVNIIERPSHPDRAVPNKLQKALECLEGRGVVRRRSSGTEDEDIWLLHHDFLCRGVLAADRFANRWPIFLQEHASQFRDVAGPYRRWQALLPPWQQLRLGLARAAGKFHYAKERRYALLSTFRFVPYLLFVIMFFLAFQQYRSYEDGLQAGVFFAAIEGWTAQDAAGNRAASKSFLALAASSNRVRWKVLQLAFSGEENAWRAHDMMPTLLRLCLQLDPEGDLRARFWCEIMHPALEKEAGANVIHLALQSWEEAPDDSRDTQLLARAVGRFGKVKEWSWVTDSDFWYFARLAQQIETPLAQSLAGEILDAMKGRSSMKDGFRDLETLQRLAKALTPFAPRLSSEQAGTLAEILATVADHEKKNGETWGANESWRRHVLDNLAEPLLVCFSRLDTVNPQILGQTVVNVVKFKVPAWRSEGRPQGDFARVADMLKGLDESHRAQAADLLLNEMLQEDYPFRQSSLARGLKLLVGEGAMGLQQQAVRRLLTVLDRETNAEGVLAISSALGDYTSLLSVEQGRHAVERLFSFAQGEKNYQRFGLLAQALGIIAIWMNENEAQRVCKRLVEDLITQPYIQGALKGLPSLASLLSAGQVHTLITSLVTNAIRESANPLYGNLTELAVVPSVKELAGLLGPDQLQTFGKTFVELVLGERDPHRLQVWCKLIPTIANRLDPNDMHKICNRLAEAIDEPSQLAAIKAWVEPKVINKVALRLIDSVERQKSTDKKLGMAEALAGMADRLAAENVQKAAETSVNAFLRSKKWDQLILYIDKLSPLDDAIPEHSLQALAQRVAQGIEQSTAKVELYAYVLREPAQARNITALLHHASDQILLDILKQPFAVEDVQTVVLRTFEQKYARHFDDDLWHFMQWATSDPHMRNLDFHSPPRSDFSIDEIERSLNHDATE